MTDEVVRSFSYIEACRYIGKNVGISTSDVEEVSLDDCVAVRFSEVMRIRQRMKLLQILKLLILVSVNILFFMNASEASSRVSDASLQSGVRANYSIDFANGLQGCSAGFADYPVDPDQHGIYNLNWELAVAPHAPKKTALMVTGTNRSDDLFMFGKCYIDAKLKPGSLHSIAFEITAAVDAPQGCFGAGGAPDALTLKAGASMIEPQAVSDGGSGEFESYVLNLDKGNQSVGGRDLAVISTRMNNGLKCEDVDAYQFKTIVKKSSVASGFTADSRGGFWIVWGTDSGYESESTIYYEKIRFEIQ